jgi:hypothetical protein
MTLYCTHLDGVLCGPTVLPSSLRKADGSTVTNLSALSEEELNELDYYEYTGDPTPFDSRWQLRTNRTLTLANGKVTESHDLVSIPLQELMQARITEVYMMAAAKLDEQSAGRSAVEVATWPHVKEDVAIYLSTRVIGPNMQAALNTSAYDADGLAAMLSVKAQYEDAVFLARKTHMANIKAKTTRIEVVEYDVTTIWP